MKKELIQTQIRNKISLELGNGTPMTELKALANEVIELCQRHPGEHIPNKDLLVVLNNYPALTKDLIELVRKEYDSATDETLELIRQGLKGRMS